MDHRYDFAALLTTARGDRPWHTNPCDNCHHGNASRPRSVACVRPRDILAQLGISPTTAARYERDGLTDEQAERYATRIGYHPFTIWPEMADHRIAAITRICQECSTPFVPNRGFQRYCSHACGHRQRNREWARQRYAADPDFRAQQLQRNNIYYQECRDAILTQQRTRKRSAK